MRRILFVLLLSLLAVSPAFSLNTIKVGDDTVTPFLDASICTQHLWGGVVNYVNGIDQYYSAEAGIRYDHEEKDYKVVSNISMVRFNDKTFDVGDLNFGFLFDKQQLFLGQGTFPFGVIMKNHHTNNRPEVWAPTTLSVFSYNIIGEYKRAAYYQYSFDKFKIKSGLIEDVVHYTNEEFRARRVYTPIISLDLQLTRNIEFEQAYSTYNNLTKTYITSLGIDLPKDFRLEVERVQHKRNGDALSILDAPDSNIAVIGNTLNNMNMYMDGLTYTSYEIILSKFTTIKTKPVTFFTEYFTGKTATDYYLVSDGMTLMSFHENYPYGHNQQFRVGYCAEIAPSVQWATEWEHNGLDVLPHWSQRWITSLRLKL
jgi:hypothetical protein